MRELLELRPRSKIEFWTDRKYYKNVVKITTEIGLRWGREERGGSRKNPYIRVRRVWSGKFRRYAGWKIKDYFEHFDLVIRDLVLGNFLGFLSFSGGIVMTFFRFLLEGKPDVVFLKGGFVGLPVGIVSRLFRVPYIIHESDATVGLANKLLMRKAKVVAMGVPFDEGKENWVWTGIPVAEEFREIKLTEQKKLKQAFGFDKNKPLVVVTGGSQGSLNINNAMRQILPEMMKIASVGLVAGNKYYEEMVDLKKYEVWENARLKSNFRMWGFSPVMHELMGAADVVVSRAGATTIAELAMLGKAVILVPFERLPGGHQVKNAKRIEKMGGAVVVMDAEMYEDANKLLKEVLKLVKDNRKRKDLGQGIMKSRKLDSAKMLAEIVLEVAEK